MDDVEKAGKSSRVAFAEDQRNGQSSDALTRPMARTKISLFFLSYPMGIIKKKIVFLTHLSCMARLPCMARSDMRGKGG